MARTSPLVARALERAAAYRAHGEESTRAVFAAMALEGLGWKTLRGRGARRVRLDRHVADTRLERPELFDWSYRRVADNIRVKTLHLLVQEWFTHLRDTTQRWHHVDEADLPSWARRAFNSVSTKLFAETGKRWVAARHAASDRFIAQILGIAPRTVKRRRHGPFAWVPVEVGSRGLA